MTFGGVIGEWVVVEVGHANEGVARLVVRGQVATYRHHHGKPYQLDRKLILERWLALHLAQFVVSIIANEVFLALRTATHGAETGRREKGRDEDGEFTYTLARAYLAVEVVPKHVACI